MDSILRIDLGAKDGPAIHKEPAGAYAGMGGRGLTSTLVAKEVPPSATPSARRTSSSSPPASSRGPRPASQAAFPSAARVPSPAASRSPTRAARQPRSWLA